MSGAMNGRKWEALTLVLLASFMAFVACTISTDWVRGFDVALSVLLGMNAILYFIRIVDDDRHEGS